MLVLITTFVSPHTLPLGVALSEYYDRVVFINTLPLTQERKQMGYAVEDERVEILDLDRETQCCMQLIREADAVILAGDRFELVQQRIEAGKQVFLLHERIFKKGLLKLLDPRTWRMAKFCRSVRAFPVYLLAIGENAAKDFARLGFCKNKILRFGYFPKHKEYLPEQLKKEAPHKILWVGRFVDFKRPLMAVKAMRKMDGRCTLTMAGAGKLYDKTVAYAEKYKLPVRFLGNIPAAEVEQQMLSHGVLLSTSHKGEGWGAVVNEGMNRGCAVVCAREIGCAGTLATDENAVIFKTNSVTDLRRALCKAISCCEQLGEAGYKTITERFNSQVAAERFVAFARGGEVAEEGVCSKVF